MLPPSWFSSWLLSQVAASAAATAPLPSILPSNSTDSVAAAVATVSAMTNYMLHQHHHSSSSSTTPIEIMDRKKKKPVMEKQRRDRMNKALEDLKVIIIRHDPNHTSKLEKADILEKTLELVRFFEFQINQTRFQTIHTIFDGLSRNKIQPDVIKSVSDVVASIFPPPPRPPPQQQQQMPSTMTQASRMQLPIHPIFFPSSMNPLLLHQQPRPQFIIPQSFTPKPANAPSISTPLPATLIKAEPSPSKTIESRTNSRAESSSSGGEEEEEEIDIEKVDEGETVKHDETFSPPLTPKQSRKRSHGSSSVATEEDSGVFEADAVSPPKKQKPTTSSFSIDGILK